MAMEMNGNFSDYAVRKQNYSSYGAQGMAGSKKKQETEKTQETAESGKSKNTAEYVNRLETLVPSVNFRVGSVCSSAQRGKSLTVNPKLLEKMQKDPETEKDMKDMIKGVESMSKLAESLTKASGWTIVYQHSYIDENGKYHCRMQTRNDGMLKLSGKLRKKRREISEKLIEKSKEKAAKRKEKLEELLEAKKETEKAGEGAAEKGAEGSAYGKAEQLLNEKTAASKDGTIYLNDTDMRIIIEAAQEDGAGKAAVKNQVQVGANLDLKI